MNRGKKWAQGTCCPLWTISQEAPAQRTGPWQIHSRHVAPYALRSYTHRGCFQQEFLKAPHPHPGGEASPTHPPQPSTQPTLSAACPGCLMLKRRDCVSRSPTTTPPRVDRKGSGLLSGPACPKASQMVPLPSTFQPHPAVSSWPGLPHPLSVGRVSGSGRAGGSCQLTYISALSGAKKCAVLGSSTLGVLLVPPEA